MPQLAVQTVTGNAYEVEALETGVSGIVVVPDIQHNLETGEVVISDEKWALYAPESGIALPIRFTSPGAAQRFAETVLQSGTDEYGYSWEDLNQVSEEQDEWFTSILDELLYMQMVSPDVQEIYEILDETGAPIRFSVRVFLDDEASDEVFDEAGEES